MGRKLLCLLVASTLIAYYIYQPLPENVEEPWKLTLLEASIRSLNHAATIVEKLGLGRYIDVINLYMMTGYTAPTSDEKVIVTDTEFSHIPVRLYIPTKQSDVLKRAVIFIHGGGWCSASARMKAYDLLSRWTSERLNAVVVSVDYRLAPKYRFPVAFEDVYSVSKYFLQSSILEKYNVDPSRIAIAGDSAGGNLAAAVTQQILDDPDIKTKFKIQALLYPVLQTIDLELPSYQDNKNMPILSKTLMVRLLSEYITSNDSFSKALESNQHVPAEFNHLFKFVNWSKWLPEKFKKGHIYTDPSHRNSKTGHKYPGLLDPRLAPLLVEDIKLWGLPLTYVLTCQYDVLRDDGIMYVSRLREAGVEVTHEHVDNFFHGVVSFITGPFALNIGQRMANNYIEWLNKNL
ncbi:arylacetamide deacetylase-like isoform X1 [Thamnophis elegans]|uniref:arylacetamide deacetylase-like isoform X1 n=1 Tax=Thamnophis elegans TaxID=35005 RepID=UPI001377DE0A|nr:arylacetamide deacetylase-like isoform X1 [Thamnophis elegans]